MKLAMWMVLLAGVVFSGGLSAQGVVKGEVKGEVGTRWVYPQEVGRRDPVLPPAALYSGEGFPDLEVSSVMYNSLRPSEARAVVFLGGRNRLRKLVGPGDRIGDYRIVKIVDASCLQAVLHSLGSERLVRVCRKPSR